MINKKTKYQCSYGSDSNESTVMNAFIKNRLVFDKPKKEKIDFDGIFSDVLHNKKRKTF